MKKAKIMNEDLSMKQIKYSRQREAIKNFLVEHTDHPTADMIYAELREEYPNISLGTVYRNLSLLAERGEIIKFSCEGRIDRFDGKIQPHYHFFCKDCGSVFDLAMKEQTKINQIANEGFDGIIESHQLAFFGKCSKCTKEKLHSSNM